MAGHKWGDPANFADTLKDELTESWDDRAEAIHLAQSVQIKLASDPVWKAIMAGREREVFAYLRQMHACFMSGDEQATRVAAFRVEAIDAVERYIQSTFERADLATDSLNEEIYAENKIE